ncbi:hypothetical protein [Lacihabitans soyangensis]|uniref:Uncharacterized protein n=1 Tax=Lacihabitans soyangensis TaxID=869394 RepID=A0AAE3KW77_9BACT|nr:hypothetical protein [Lacihabitans soyangensis]MCP9765186.1 hypothetical protein [Lacihabitans soyangensis]
MKGLKDIFLESQYWMMTIHAAFQRANVYKANVDENKRKEFREYLHVEIQQIAEKYYFKVDEDKHLKNIEKLQEYSRNEDILQNGVLNYGICQKILNLYLKYLWCAGRIPTPPHFPIDRVVQERLGFKENEIVSWTKQIKSEIDYLSIIRKTENILAQTYIDTLAELELELYTHNNLKELLKK